MKDYNQGFFQKTVPKSCLIQELVNKFIEVPLLAFEANGDPMPSFDDISKNEMELRQNSVFFTALEAKKFMKTMMHLAQGQDEKYIRRYKALYNLKINKENLEYIMNELLKY